MLTYQVSFEPACRAPGNWGQTMFHDTSFLNLAVAKRELDYLHCDNICRGDGLGFKRERAFYKWVTPASGK